MGSGIEVTHGKKGEGQVRWDGKRLGRRLERRCGRPGRGCGQGPGRGRFQSGQTNGRVHAAGDRLASRWDSGRQGRRRLGAMVSEFMVQVPG